MLTWLARVRPGLALAAVVVALGTLLPPAGSYARQYAFAGSLQFVIFAVVAPALLVLGAPWRFWACRATGARAGALHVCAAWQVARRSPGRPVAFRPAADW